MSSDTLQHEDAETARQREAVLEAMRADLGLNRVEALPMENKRDGAQQVPRRGAQPPPASSRPVNVWTAAIASGKFHDEDHDAVKNLPNIGDGQLHRAQNAAGGNNTYGRSSYGEPTPRSMPYKHKGPGIVHKGDGPINLPSLTQSNVANRQRPVPGNKSANANGSVQQRQAAQRSISLTPVATPRPAPASPLQAVFDFSKLIFPVVAPIIDELFRAPSRAVSHKGAGPVVVSIRGGAHKDLRVFVAPAQTIFEVNVATYEDYMCSDKHITPMFLINGQRSNQWTYHFQDPATVMKFAQKLREVKDMAKANQILSVASPKTITNGSEVPTSLEQTSVSSTTATKVATNGNMATAPKIVANGATATMPRAQTSMPTATVLAFNANGNLSGPINAETQVATSDAQKTVPNGTKSSQAHLHGERRPSAMAKEVARALAAGTPLKAAPQQEVKNQADPYAKQRELKDAKRIEAHRIEAGQDRMHAAMTKPHEDAANHSCAPTKSINPASTSQMQVPSDSPKPAVHCLDKLDRKNPLLDGDKWAHGSSEAPQHESNAAVQKTADDLVQVSDDNQVPTEIMPYQDHLRRLRTALPTILRLIEAVGKDDLDVAKLALLVKHTEDTLANDVVFKRFSPEQKQMARDAILGFLLSTEAIKYSSKEIFELRNDATPAPACLSELKFLPQRSQQKTQSTSSAPTMQTESALKTIAPLYVKQATEESHLAKATPGVQGPSNVEVKAASALAKEQSKEQVADLSSPANDPKTPTAVPQSKPSVNMGLDFQNWLFAGNPSANLTADQKAESRLASGVKSAASSVPTPIIEKPGVQIDPSTQHQKQSLTGMAKTAESSVSSRAAEKSIGYMAAEAQTCERPASFAVQAPSTEKADDFIAQYLPSAFVATSAVTQEKPVDKTVNHSLPPGQGTPDLNALRSPTPSSIKSHINIAGGDNANGSGPVVGPKFIGLSRKEPTAAVSALQAIGSPSRKTNGTVTAVPSRKVNGTPPAFNVPSAGGNTQPVVNRGLRGSKWANDTTLIMQPSKFCGSAKAT